MTKSLVGLYISKINDEECVMYIHLCLTVTVYIIQYENISIITRVTYLSIYIGI